MFPLFHFVCFVPFVVDSSEQWENLTTNHTNYTKKEEVLKNVFLMT